MSYFVTLLAGLLVGTLMSVNSCNRALDHQQESNCGKIGAEPYYTRSRTICKKPDGSLWAMPPHE